MKLCKDCKWVTNETDYEGEFAKCTAPAGTLCVTGFEKGPYMHYCSIQRDAGWLWALIAPDGGRCGKAGRWFEPKI